MAQTIEKHLTEAMMVGEGEPRQKIIPYQVIVTNLITEIGNGKKKAHPVFRKYEAFANTKPALKRYTAIPSEEAAERYNLLCAGAPDWKTRKLNLPPLSPEQEKRRAMEVRIERMKAGLEEPFISPDMTFEEAAEVYKIPSPPPPRPRHRPKRKAKLEAGEVFDQVINAAVSVRERNQISTAPRMAATAKKLLIKAMKGDINAAGMLMDLHAHSVKHGDFCPRVKLIPR